MRCPPIIQFSVRSFNPKVIGDQGAKGIAGIQGPVGPNSPASLYISGENREGVYLRLNDAYQTFLSQNIAKMGVPNPLAPQSTDVTMITGQYLCIFRGEVDLNTIDAYVAARIKYNGVTIPNTTMHIGDVDHANTEATPFGPSFHIQCQGLANVTNLSHLIEVELINEADDITKTPKSIAEIFRGNLIMIRVETVVP